MALAERFALPITSSTRYVLESESLTTMSKNTETPVNGATETPAMPDQFQALMDQAKRQMGTATPKAAATGAIAGDVDKFIFAAIRSLRKPYTDKSTGQTVEPKGIHTVVSGFNQAFRIAFPSLDPIVETKRLADAGKIVLKPVRRGMYMLLAEDAATAPDRAKALPKSLVAILAELSK